MPKIVKIGPVLFKEKNAWFDEFFSNETFWGIFQHCDMTILCVSNQFGQTAKEEEGSHTTDFLLACKADLWMIAAQTYSENTFAHM